MALLKLVLHQIDFDRLKLTHRTHRHGDAVITCLSKLDWLTTSGNTDEILSSNRYKPEVEIGNRDFGIASNCFFGAFLFRREQPLKKASRRARVFQTPNSVACFSQ